MRHTPKHRHLVVLPFFSLLLLALVGVHHSLPVRAALFPASSHDQLLTAETEERSLRLPTDTALTLERGTSIRVTDEGGSMTLLQGGVLVESPGITHVSVGSVTADVLASRSYALFDGATATFIAITEPLLLHVDETRLLLPGRQLRVDANGNAKETPVPASWIRPFADLGPVSPSSSQSFDVLAHEMHALSDLPALLSRTQGVSDDLSFLAALILLGRLPAAMQAPLVSPLFDLFPEDAVRAIPTLLLTSPVQLLPDIHRAWKENFLRYAAAHPVDSAEFLRSISALPEALTKAGLPRQSKVWEEALHSVLDVTAALLPPRSAAELRSAYALEQKFAPPPAPDAEVVQHDQSRSESNTSEKELLSIGWNLLLVHDALIGPATSVTIDASDRQSVRLENFSLAEGGRDVRYDCVYTPATERISDIVREGTPLPNSLTVQQFFKH